MTDRIRDALQWLTGEISVDRQDFRNAHGPGSDALLDGLVSHGYARHDRGRYGVTPIGFLRMGDVDVDADEEFEVDG